MSGQAEAERVVERWGDEHIVDSQDLAMVTWRANAMTHMAGQLFVHDIELDRVRDHGLASPGETFLRLAFEEAIRHFEARRLVDPDEFAELLDAERFRAFTVTRAIAARVVEDAKRRIAEAMRPDGPGLREFIRALLGEVEADDYPGGARRYLENVYRTTTATSYNAGRLRQLTDPDVVAGIGAYVYSTALDTRVRSSHAAAHGKQWRPDDPDLRRVWPPNGFQCRCVVRAVAPEDVDPDALRREVDLDALIQDGFGAAPDAIIAREAE